MSDLLAAAAAALGTPESIVKRSAEAKAAQTGQSVDEILAAWAGGQPTGAVAAPSEATSGPTQAPAAETTVAAVPAPVAMTAPPPPPTAPVSAAPATTASGKPPVLVAPPDNPMIAFYGAVGLFLVVFLIGLVGPSVQADEPGARTSEIALSQGGENGQVLYESLGCAACHTQLVRPVVADVGLGPATLNDTNQIIGSRRFGPDLSDVGSRLDAAGFEEVLSGSGRHRSYDLSSEDLDALVAYLTESSTSGGGS